MNRTEIIESTTTPGIFYKLITDEAGTTCSCPGFKHRRTCKHVYLADMARWNQHERLEQAESMLERIYEIFREAGYHAR